MAKAVVITVEVPEVEAYRKSCGLGKLVPDTHLSIFTQEIQPLPELKEKQMTFVMFIDREGESKYLNKLKTIFKKSKFLFIV